MRVKLIRKIDAADRPEFEEDMPLTLRPSPARALTPSAGVMRGQSGRLARPGAADFLIKIGCSPIYTVVYSYKFNSNSCRAAALWR